MADRQDPARLVLLDEAVLYAKFRVARPPLEGTSPSLVDGHARLEMQLNVGQAAIIAVARRRDAIRLRHRMRSHREGVYFPVQIIDGLRIVGDERRSRHG